MQQQTWRNWSFVILMVAGLILAVGASACDDGGGDDASDSTDGDGTTVDAAPPPPDAAPPPPDAMPPPPDAMPITGVEATVNYAGAAQGTLLLAAFTSFPPMGPPQGLAQEPSPTFPATLQIPDMAPGDYFVVAILDVAPASPTQPGPEDRQAVSSKITVVAGQPTLVELTLMDPP